MCSLTHMRRERHTHTHAPAGAWGCSMFESIFAGYSCTRACVCVCYRYLTVANLPQQPSDPLNRALTGYGLRLTCVDPAAVPCPRALLATGPCGNPSGSNAGQCVTVRKGSDTHAHTDTHTGGRPFARTGLYLGCKDANLLLPTICVCVCVYVRVFACGCVRVCAQVTSGDPRSQVCKCVSGYGDYGCQRPMQGFASSGTAQDITVPLGQWAHFKVQVHTHTHTHTRIHVYARARTRAHKHTSVAAFSQMRGVVPTGMRRVSCVRVCVSHRCPSLPPPRPRPYRAL